VFNIGLLGRISNAFNPFKLSLSTTPFKEHFQKHIQISNVGPTTYEIMPQSNTTFYITKIESKYSFPTVKIQDETGTQFSIYNAAGSQETRDLEKEPLVLKGKIALSLTEPGGGAGWTLTMTLIGYSQAF